MSDRASAKPFSMERFYQALGDDTRLRLINLMGNQEVCVCYFVEILGQTQSKISRHLAYLRKAGIVAARRQGTWMHYRLVVPAHGGVAGVLRATLFWMHTDHAMQRDRARFSQACCSPSNYALLQGAPLPVKVHFQEAL